MNEGVFHIPSSIRLPRLLIVQKNFAAIEPLIQTCGDRRLDVDFDVCSSPYSAVGMLLASPYQLIISGAHIAELDDFLLLKRIQAQESFVPVVITASASEKEAARRVLAQGAFDLLPSPLDHEQTVGTIRLALWQGKLKNLIARKEAALEKYQQHLADYPDDLKNIEDVFQRAISAFEDTIASVAQTILRIEQSTVCFADFASQVEYHARKRALERLDSIYPPPHDFSDKRFKIGHCFASITNGKDQPASRSQNLLASERHAHHLHPNDPAD